LLVVFLLLGMAARQGHVFGWDTGVLSFLRGREEAAEGTVVDRAANLIVEVGGNTATFFLGLMSLSVLLMTRRLRDAGFVIATGIAILTLTPLAKDYFERTDLKYSFPSGNAARSAAVVAAAILIAWPTRFRWPIVVLGTVLTATVGIALVWENWHLPSDVVGGWCLGIGCAIALRWIVGASVESTHASSWAQSRVR
jgi:membrane-associated phospholipid phosphatase